MFSTLTVCLNVWKFVAHLTSRPTSPFSSDKPSLYFAHRDRHYLVHFVQSTQSMHCLFQTFTIKKLRSNILTKNTLS